MDVCKCIVPLRQGGTLNSRRAASPLAWLVEGKERCEAPVLPQGILPQNRGDRDPKTGLHACPLNESISESTGNEFQKKPFPLESKAVTIRSSSLTSSTGFVIMFATQATRGFLTIFFISLEPGEIMRMAPEPALSTLQTSSPY
ncbi:hypothetical protein TNCV_4208811 [Trichonephila clavipes]|nr:hypothetical protein TNCV_4208811 [Trichonephila clavipes]